MDTRLPWKDEYCLGHDVIDSEHKKLFSIANQIFTIKEPHNNSAIIKKHIHELYDYMRYHFEHEEEFMAELSFAELEPHRKKHAELIEEMNNILKGSKDFNILELRLVYMMQKWLLKHILEEDLKVKMAIDFHELNALVYCP